MAVDFKKYLLDAVGKEKNALSEDNLYRDIGFDGDKRRLGWVKPVEFSKIKKALEDILSICKDKENFIFIGMGGSINGIKPLLNLFKVKSFYTLDNLDPKALFEIIDRIGDKSKTLVIPVSKSGTTKETQLLALSLKNLFAADYSGIKWQEHFLWLSDPTAFDKLESLGWSGVKKVPIQFDGDTDIGGRFSSPHTLIFFLPLFLLLNKDFDKLGKIYDSFIKSQDEAREVAYILAEACKNQPKAYFSPHIDKEFGESLSSWVVQLFQESLGSKMESLPVKTIPNFNNEKFFIVRFDSEIDDLRTFLMVQMYFFQMFIAYYSACKKINFVTQNFVEKYKSEMQRLENNANDQSKIRSLDLDGIIEEIKKNIKPYHDFLEVVLYFNPEADFIKNLKIKLKECLPGKEILIFGGSDWNHQSYQAAFSSEDTFYVLLTKEYRLDIPLMPKAVILKNIETQIVIAQATYLTLADKALIFSLDKIY